MRRYICLYVCWLFVFMCVFSKPKGRRANTTAYSLNSYAVRPSFGEVRTVWEGIKMHICAKDILNLSLVTHIHMYIQYIQVVTA